jgi:hypothetical protein
MTTTAETIVKRIDAIVYELQELRRTILEETQPSDKNLVEQLYGVLGKGTWDEYDHHIDWKRFAA